MRVLMADDFFQTERDRAYADWKLAFWRELFQNAIDQNAREIRIHIEEGSECIRLTFSDDGPGMSRKVLEEVYFRIGATSKTSGQIGGMGRARIMTCFAMKTYRIRSDNYEVVGQAGEYDILDAPVTKGCTLIIEAENTSVETMTRKLNEFLGESRIAAKVYVNNVLNTTRADLNGRHARDLIAGTETFAKVYVNKKVESNRVIIRVHGVSMYSIYTSANAQIVVELEPGLSRTVLTSNRDGLRGLCRDALDAFLRELSVDTKSSLRPRFESRTNVTRGGGLLSLKAKRAPKVVASSEPFAFSEHRSEPARQPETSRLAHEGIDTFNETPVIRDAFGQWLSKTFGDIFIFDETATPEVRKVVPNYFTENWRPTTINGKTFRKGGKITKVLLLWHTAILYALEASVDILGVDTLRYGVGFVFADDRRAEHRKEGEGHLFLLNPVEQTGKLGYSVRDRRSLKRLMTLAKHEVAHVAVSWHGEEFSGIREQIDEVFDDLECFRRMKDALDAVPNFPEQMMRMAA